MKYFYLISISAILLILVHSFYSWDQNQRGDHLVASFKQLMESPQPQAIASAVEQATKSSGEDLDLLCEEIIKIVWTHPLGKLTSKISFNTDSYIAEHSTLTKTHSMNTEQVRVKKTVPQLFHGWFKP